MKHLLLTNILLLSLISCSSQQAAVDKPLPLWKNGELDIHFINTARGECTYQILPDGTTFLVDASGTLLKFGVKASEPLPSKPSDDISAGKVIADYIDHFSPVQSAGKVDYLLVTHFDGDHIGAYSDDLPEHESGRFRLSSLPEIGSSIVFGKIMDRCYPDYDYPRSLDDAKMMNYRAFLEWTAEENGTELDAWDVGSSSQVVPLHDASCGVSVRNYSGNGSFWTGEGEESFTVMPSAEEFAAGPSSAVPAENAFSCSYILTYGDFDFFLGGDLQYNDREDYPYKDAESPVAKVAHKVEVMKANHHGTNETNGPELLGVLKPDVWVVSNWRDVQPRPATVDRVLAANPDCDIYSTNMPEINIPKLGEQRLEHFMSVSGHVVVRVARGGESYMVYVLDDTDQEYRVKSVNGPYSCVK